MPKEKLTRGFGLLESFLSIRRAKKAQSLIKKHNKRGKILDLGCGIYPYFLVNSNFDEKYGIDQEIETVEFKHLKLKLFNYNIDTAPKLPFEKDHFDVITMLAVIEHLNLDQIFRLLRECSLILKKDGILIITTPAYWSDIILKIMATFRIASPDEIFDHKGTFNLQQLIDLLIKTDFKRERIQIGYFEFHLNFWICAKK